MTKTGLDGLIHSQARLQICALLTPVDMAEFQFLRDEIGVSDSVLSKHIKQLEEACYVKLIKKKKDGRQHTWLAITRIGRMAFRRHMTELTRIASIAGVTFDE